MLRLFILNIRHFKLFEHKRIAYTLEIDSKLTREFFSADLEDIHEDNNNNSKYIP